MRSKTGADFANERGAGLRTDPPEISSRPQFSPERRPSKVFKDLGDIARLIEAHPEFAAALPEDAARAIAR